MKTPSYEYELLHQFEVIFRDGEHKTQAATRDYSKVWESVIDNPPEEGVTPIHVYRLNGTTCAVIAGMDELVENEECAMEIARLSARLAEDAKVRAGLVEALGVARTRFRLVMSAEGRGFGIDYIDGCAAAAIEEIDAALAAAKERG